MAIKFKNKIIDTASYNGIELTRISVNGELIFYQPYLYELPLRGRAQLRVGGCKDRRNTQRRNNTSDRIQPQEGRVRRL